MICAEGGGFSRLESPSGEGILAYWIWGHLFLQIVSLYEVCWILSHLFLLIVSLQDATVEEHLLRDADGEGTHGGRGCLLRGSVALQTSVADSCTRPVDIHQAVCPLRGGEALWELHPQVGVVSEEDVEGVVSEGQPNLTPGPQGKEIDKARIHVHYTLRKNKLSSLSSSLSFINPLPAYFLFLREIHPFSLRYFNVLAIQWSPQM